MRHSSKDKITLKGLVVPARWDKNGDILGIAIAGSDEREYPVLMDNIGRNLMVFMHEVVNIIGTPVKMDNSEVIKVMKFNKISI